MKLLRIIMIIAMVGVVSLQAGGKKPAPKKLTPAQQKALKAKQLAAKKKAMAAQAKKKAIAGKAPKVSTYQFSPEAKNLPKNVQAWLLEMAQADQKATSLMLERVEVAMKTIPQNFISEMQKTAQRVKELRDKAQEWAYNQPNSATIQRIVWDEMKRIRKYNEQVFKKSIDKFYKFMKSLEPALRDLGPR